MPAPIILTNFFDVKEDQTKAGTLKVFDADGDAVTFTITGGPDQSLFTINGSTGVLSFNTAPDFDNPADSDGDNVYKVKVTVTDGKHSSTEVLSVTVEKGPSPIIVTTDKDVVDARDGVTSLREAVAQAEKNAGASLITFAEQLKGKTVVLTQGELAITHRLEIVGDVDGDGKADITVSGNDASRIFAVSGAKNDVRLESLTLSNGASAANGGAVLVSGGATLTLVNATIADSQGLDGGAVFVDGKLVVANSLFTGNAAQDGGAIALGKGSSAQILNATLTGNHAAGDGGAVAVEAGGSLSLGHVTMVLNEAKGAGGGIAAAGDVIIRNSAIGQNAAASDADVSIARDHLSASHSVFGSDVAGLGRNSGNLENVLDFRLGQLLDHGGATLSFAPRDGSLLIDAGGTPMPRDAGDIDHDGNRGEALPLDASAFWRIWGEAADAGAVEWRADQRITGTDRADRIAGGKGDDWLDGGLGRDRLNGGQGHDTYVLHRDQGHDIVQGFKPGADRIALTGAEFGFKTGALPGSAFSLDRAAGSAAQLVYDTGSGKLFFDADGTGSSAPSLIAILTGHPVLAAGDLFVM